MGNRPPQFRATLPCIQSLLLHIHDLRTFLYDFFAFGQDEFDMAGIRHIRVDLYSSIRAFAFV